jgi:uncharacterized DUF497 family protein
MSRYTWDPEKAIDNLAKHGITFEEAWTVDLDPLRRIRPDPFHDPGDERQLMIGHSSMQQLLVVVTSERGPRPRIISARRATKRERHAYEARP